jgi:hypothetical protein
MARLVVKNPHKKHMCHGTIEPCAQNILPIHNSKFNRKHNWEDLTYIMQSLEEIIFNTTSYNFCISTPLMIQKLLKQTMRCVAIAN